MAIKMSESIGSKAYAEWGPLLIRLPLGMYFMMAGWIKLGDIKGFIAEAQKFEILPQQFATLYGILLPYLEIGAGFLLIMGAWTTLAAIFTSLALLSFVIALRLFPDGKQLFNKDVILLAASLSLLFSGPGVFSIDRFRKSG